MAKKEYNNVFCKMQLIHNEETVPFLKKIGSGTLKIRNHRKLQILDELEDDNNYINNDLYNEYLLMNKFVIEFLKKEEFDACMELLNTNSTSNKVIGGNMLYSLIENKKKYLHELYSKETILEEIN